jgi:hypothetical protein
VRSALRALPTVCTRLDFFRPNRFRACSGAGSAINHCYIRPVRKFYVLSKVIRASIAITCGLTQHPMQCWCLDECKSRWINDLTIVFRSPVCPE